MSNRKYNRCVCFKPPCVYRCNASASTWRTNGYRQRTRSWDRVMVIANRRAYKLLLWVSAESMSNSIQFHTLLIADTWISSLNSKDCEAVYAKQKKRAHRHEVDIKFHESRDDAQCLQRVSGTFSLFLDSLTCPCSSVHALLFSCNKPMKSLLMSMIKSMMSAWMHRMKNDGLSSSQFLYIL